MEENERAKEKKEKKEEKKRVLYLVGIDRRNMSLEAGYSVVPEPMNGVMERCVSEVRLSCYATHGAPYL